MAIIQSGGALVSYGAQPPISPALAPYQYRSALYAYAHYAQIYVRQPNVRIVIDFLGDCMAQLGWHVFKRVSDTDRRRLSDYPLNTWLKTPSPEMTQFRLMQATMKDFLIYYCAYWLKQRRPDGTLANLLRLPPDCVEIEGYLSPARFWTLWPDGQRIAYDPSEIVYFGGYDPRDPLRGVSPLETLRDTLAEEAAARQYRQSYWYNSARIESVIERPATAPPWTPERKQAFREQWQARFAGTRNAGLTPVLEDGMSLKPIAFSARDSEYIAARKLTREECAAAYNVPQPSVGILDHATFSNIREQHKQLYQDTLGPWCKFFEQEFMRQLLPECELLGEDTEDVYVEANIAEKLRGSFEEQANSIFMLTGRPIMTANEGRARLNLPASDDPGCDEVAMPLNLTTAADVEDAADAAEDAADYDAASELENPPEDTADGDGTAGDDELAFTPHGQPRRIRKAA